MESIVSQQQRFAAVQHDVDRIKLMDPGVLAYAQSRLADRRLSYDLGLGTPTLIGVFIDIAVITSKITPAAYLQDVLTYGSRHALVSY
jgi:hypothetical protein